LLGIAGSFVATYLGQALGWYQAGEGAGLIGAIGGAIIVLVVGGSLPRGNRQPSRDFCEPTNGVDLSSRG
jgi:uncharacterized membrane protein YeaQ/YmgE (transglycosylase-associated protein family)